MAVMPLVAPGLIHRGLNIASTKKCLPQPITFPGKINKILSITGL
jgi:hypothetical protein